MVRRESSLRSVVVETLREFHAIAVENPALPGTPDVNYVGGWLELKSLDRWPARAATPVRIEHWTPQQRVWHVLRARAGGRSFVLIEIVDPGDVLLLDGPAAVSFIGKANRAQLLELAVKSWPNRAGMRADLLPLLRCPPPLVVPAT